MSQPSRRPDAPSSGRPARRSPARTTGKVLGALCLLALAGVSVYGGYLYRSSPTARHYLPFLMHPKTADQAFPNQKTLNLMIIGRDRDYDDYDRVLKTRARSDLLMMAHLDFDKQTISLLSIPRDTLAKIDDGGKTRVTKINAAHQLGGPALSEQTVQENFGIPSDKYVALDFEGFEQAIDILGGVDLAVDKKMDYDDNWGHLHIHLKPGFQHLNGRQAIGFVRFRHSDSDLVRTTRQQALLAALKGKLLQPQTFARIGPLLDTIDRHVDSDLTPEQKIALAQFAHDTPRAQVSMTTLPSREVGNDVATDWAQAGPVITKIFGVSPPEDVAEAGDGGHHRRHRRHHRAVRVASLP